MKRRAILFFLLFLLQMGSVPTLAAEPTVAAQGAALIDGKTGRLLWGKNADVPLAMASTTKIMTAILVLERARLTEVVTVSKNAAQQPKVHMSLQEGEQWQVGDLLSAMLLRSYNDAAVALAEQVSGNVAKFCAEMTKKAKEIGARDTVFGSPNGLDSHLTAEQHHSTAYDMALLGRYAMQNQKFREIVSAQYWDVPPTNKDSDGYHLENANRLIHKGEKDTQSYLYQYATGIKTGDTDQAGRCIVASARKDGVELICVLFGDPQGDKYRYTRFENAPKFFNWGFENYSSVSVSELNLQSSFSVPVENGAFEDGGGLTATADVSGKIIAGTRDFVSGVISSKDTITPNVTYRDGAAALTAPIAAGDEVGTVTYTCNGAAILTATLTADNSVDEIGNMISANPSESPLIFDPGASDTGSPWLFWVLIAVAILAIFMIIRIIILRSNRRRRRRRRGAAARSRTAAPIRSRSRSRRFR